MTRFHDLTVTDVRHDTRDAVVVTLAPKEEDSAAFDFTQGQYLTFRRDFDGEELRRCYSICAGKDDGVLRVGIKKVAGGAFSSWANENLKPGDVVEAMPPMGKFFTAIEPEVEKHYLGFAAGSGITPLLSIIKTVLVREPKSRFTLVYANRQVNSIMFREELEDLKNTFLGRFSVIHILDHGGQEIDLFSGPLNKEKLAGLFKAWIDPKTIDTAYICGPEPLMLAIAESLREHGLNENQIKFELFTAGQPGRAKQKAAAMDLTDANATVETTVTLDGTTHTFRMPKQDVTLLEAALANHMDVPYSCQAGVCATCKAKVLEGEVEMDNNQALEDYEVRAGYVLTCQCHPLSDKVVVSYDE